MKYPQLVSTRAVNAISDWLVSRLEQLGVEAPLIYSRLLLSLLQSSVQINDPIEFSNLETFLANRKGNYSKRYPPCDTDTLRKITAVQCLMEIVSSEQEITNIENLVDELCEKLIDIEKQSTSLEEDDDHLQIAATTELETATPSLSSSTTLNTKNEKLSSNCAANSAATTTATKTTTSTEINDTKTLSTATRKAGNQQQHTSDVEDPRKRYYRAFPALSKEMEDSIGFLRRNTKSLTWPVDRKLNLSVKNINSSTNSTNNTKLPTTAEKVKITICVDGSGSVSGGSGSGPSAGASASALLDSSQGGDCKTVLCNTAGVKRKSKRRRNQALSKGKTTAGNNLRKHSYCGGGSSSPTWDTDFEGSWEMGRDLIKEFIVKQNNRNRSTSESAAYNMAICGCGSNNSNGACETSNDIKSSLNTNNTDSTISAQTKTTTTAAAAAVINNKNNMELAEVLADPCVVEVSLCENIVENTKTDIMSSDNNNMTEGSLSTARRLYERDISNDSLNEQNLISQHPLIHHHQNPPPNQPNQNYQEDLMSSSSSMMVSLSEQFDFAQLKAKFNSSVEALWKTSNSSDSTNTSFNSDNINNNNHSLLQSSSIVSDTTTVGVAVAVGPPRSEDLKNFWTNYYSHRYDVDKGKESLDSSVVGNVAQTESGGNLFSLPCLSGGGGGGVGSDEFDKSVGGKRSAAAGGGVKTSPIGVFLQSSIWSENSNASYPDTDESFFMKVLNSTSKSQKSQDQLKMDISAGTDKSYFYPYQASKWSEGINAGPNVTAQQQHQFHLQQQQQQQQPLVVTSSSSSSSISMMDQSSASRNCFNNDFVDSTTSSSSSYLGGNPNWHLSAGNNLQADIKSWSTSNPTSLTELYGGASFTAAAASAATSSLGKKNSYNFDRNAAGPGIAVGSSSSPPTASSKITLANHSATTSGFLAYSRIKSYAKLVDAKPIAKWQKPEIDYHKQLASTPPDDENLLTSERTHFHPIKMSYADGHTFEICSNLDSVDFERSESGYLYLESERYLEYTRSDTLAEEDSSVAGHYNQPQSLTPMSRDCTSSVASTKSSQSQEFLIRFRVRNTDQACQTDSNVIGSNAYRALSYQIASSSSHLLTLPTSHISAKETGNCNDHDNDNDDDDDEWMDIGCIGGNNNPKDDEECVSMEQWSMVEITKKCIDNNNASHTLWGMCPACSSDIKSNPANRLLKAELNVEGDEIMSDLRYMQDLYIGNDWDDDQNCTRDCVDDVGHDDDDDTDLDADNIRDCDYYQAMAIPTGCGDMDEEDQQQKEILYNVNKLIADLLRPENAHSLANALGAVGGRYGLSGGGGGGHGGACKGAGNVDGQGAVVAGKADEKYIGGLWNSDENIIWKKEFNPIDIFSRFNNNNNDSFLDKLNWEYSNLAEIWEKSSPEKVTPHVKDFQSNDDQSITTSASNTITNNNNKNTTTTSADNQTDDEETIKIACRNMKNLLKSSANIIPSSIENNAALFEINERRLNDSKRMQCFLNSNKFKISNRFDRKRRHSASQNVCSSSSSSLNNNNNNNNNNNPNYSNNNSIIYDNNNSKFSFASTDSSSSTTCLLTNTPNATNNNIINNNNNTKLTATTKDTLTDNDRNIILHNADDNNRNENDQRYFSHDDDDDDNDDEQRDNDDGPPTSQRQATIITCKYWTTMQPIVNNNNNDAKVIDDNDGPRDECTSLNTVDSFFIDKNSQFIDGCLPSIALNTSSILKHVTLVSRPLTR